MRTLLDTSAAAAARRAWAATAASSLDRLLAVVVVVVVVVPAVTNGDRTRPSGAPVFGFGAGLVWDVAGFLVSTYGNE